MNSSRSVVAKCAAVALAVAAAGAASVAQARDHVSVAIGANIAPGVSLYAGNAPVYYGPSYVAPAPVYYAPAPVYYEPAPVYYGGYAPAPVVGVQWIWSPHHRRYYYIHHGHRVWR